MSACAWVPEQNYPPDLSTYDPPLLLRKDEHMWIKT